MPYIPKKDRPRLDVRVNDLAEEIVSELIKIKGTGEVAAFYEKSFITIYEVLYALETDKNIKFDSRAKLLAKEMFDIGMSRDHRPAWLGEMNYSITRLIQIVPRKMVERGVWKDEFRYWIFAQTAGALERAALEINKQNIDEKLTYILNGMVGSLFDIKDEYKRRVSSAYEAVQIRKSGDCYDGPYHTELEDIKDAGGKIIGYREIMKEYGQSLEDKNIE
jgi:hypothetical protein